MAIKIEIRNVNIFAFRLNETTDTSASFFVKREVFATKLMMNLTMKLRAIMMFKDIRS
jgi:hypothetical protein